MQDFLNRISGYSPKRLALLADELQRRVSELEQAAHAPVAIVGMACRFPGGADTPEKYWELLSLGRDAISEVPADRWSIADYYDANPDAPGKMSSRWGGFLSQISHFDPHFFGISPREAQRMDPQHRLLLEVAWEALERAGVNTDRLTGTRTGVYVGMSSVDYLQVMRASGLQSFDAYTASGAAHSIASGRLSYLLGTRGPSMSIDTACSSSLVAVHQAVISLRRGESDLALAGGVNLILRPDVTVALSKAHMMAPDGRCKAFDARADGFVRSEGCGVLVLKRLSDAEADGDPIIAVIRGTASNQDGRSNGLTAPNGAAQEAVVRAALADASLPPAAVSFVETHGTGTSLGDPIEVQALAAVFGPDRAADCPLLIGSVKANIGHAESAAGVASLIKLVLVLQHGVVPGQVHFNQPNPYIPWEEIPLRVPRVAAPFPATAEGVRVGGASSFGFSGTNVHVLLSSAPQREAAQAERERPRHVLTLSARSAGARDALLTQYKDELSQEGGPSLADIAFTANAGRAALTHRVAVVASTKTEALGRLDAIASGTASPGASVGVVAPRAPRIAFLFSGQGAQYTGMARALYETQPHFRELLNECEAILRPRLAQPLLSVLFPVDPTQSPIHDTAYTQPALFAVEYALARLWQSWGVQPSAVLGHSLGEYVAACIAGVLSLEDALTLVAERGRLMGALPRNGGMAALMTSEQQVRSLVAPWQADVAIAAVNGPEHFVISGRDSAVSAILEQAAAAGVSSTRLTVSHAFHSSLIEPMLNEFEQLAATISHRPPAIDLLSNVTGERQGSRSFTASYWREHARSPVQFARSIQALSALGYDTFVEVGPHPTLLGMARQCLGEGERSWLPSLRRGGDDWTQMLDTLAKLYVRGVNIDWARFDLGYARKKVILPSYPFQRERFWLDVAPESAEQEARPVAPPPSAPFVPLTHEIVWREGPIAGGALPSPASLSALVSPLIAAVASEAGLPGYAPFSVALDGLASQYISSALRALGADFQPGSPFNERALAERLAVIPRHSRLFARLLQILVEDGLFERVGSENSADFRVLAPLAAGDPDALAQRLLERHPDAAAEVTLTSRCARELAQVLRGKTDPLPLLFPDGSMADMERLYRTSPPAKTYNRLISEVVTVADRAWSQARPLRILEIGGGTGSTTAYVLPKLRDDRVEYTFTDLSPLFLNRAREKFASRACLRTALLDISADPVPQGFAPGSFDLIIGANVVHATPDIAVSLRNVLRLLSPGGQLVLLEGTTPQRFGDLTVGLLEGWWAFSDLARRKYALMPREAWLSAFHETGFDSAAVIVDSDSGPVLEQQAIFVAQAPVSPAASASARWLIVPDGAQVAEALAKELLSAGVDARVLGPATGSLATALSQAAATGKPITGVVQLSALDVRLDDSTLPAALWADQERLVRSALDTLHTLTTAAASGSPPSLCFVTRGAQPTHENDPVNPAQASAWGLSHVVALEHPELACRRIDLDGALPAAESMRALALELRTPSAEDQVALRGDHRLLRRLVRKAVATPGNAPNIRADRTYLITGGLRGLGLLVAGWLVAQGARSLVLMSRRPPDAAAEAALAGLRAQGAQVLAHTGDVSSEHAVAEVFAQIANTMPPLAGIVHAAGVLDDGALSRQDWARFATVMAPKVLGTWHLHRLAPPLDFFALFSSGAAIAGSAGQANHAAANAFEDALAWYRQARGLPTVSINWGPWAEVGAAADRNVSGPSFVMQIAPKDGLGALAAALAPDGAKPRLTSAQWVVIATDWSQLAKAPLAWRNSPLFRELSPALEVQAQATLAELATSELPLRERLQSVAPNRRRAALQDHVRGLTLKVLGVGRVDSFDVHEPLRQLGLDSLMAVELRNSLAKAAGRTMPATITFDYPTVSALADYIANNVFGDELFSAPAPAPIPAPDEPTPELSSEDEHDDLTSDELAARLAERLDRLLLEEPK